MAHLFINAVLLGYCLLEIPDWGWRQVRDFKSNPIKLEQIEQTFFCIGMNVFFLSANVSLKFVILNFKGLRPLSHPNRTDKVEGNTYGNRNQNQSLTNYRPVMPFRNRNFYFRGSF